MSSASGFAAAAIFCCLQIALPPAHAATGTMVSGHSGRAETSMPDTGASAEGGNIVAAGAATTAVPQPGNPAPGLSEPARGHINANWSLFDIPPAPGERLRLLIGLLLLGEIARRRLKDR